MCTKLSVRLFGKFRIQSDDETQIVIESKKALELFGYLLIYRDRPHPRETLAEVNWGDNSAAHSKKYLRQALWQFQSVLNSQLSTDCHPILIAEPDWLQLNPEAPLWLDVAEFEQACILAQRKPANELSSYDFLYFKKAANLYQGDLLEGWYEDWCLYERERLQNMCLTLYDKLMEYCELHNQYEDALAYGRQILRLDVAHERTHRRMVEIYYKSGERTEALRQYKRCVTALNDELGVQPARETIELYERISSGQEPVVHSDIEPVSSPVSTAVMLQRLSHLKKLMDTFQQHVLAEINDLEAALIQSDPEPPPTTLESISNQNKTP